MPPKRARITQAEKVAFVVEAVPAGATLQNVVVTSSDPTVMDIQMNPDGMTGFAVSTTRRGDAAVLVVAQNENGEPLANPPGDADVTVTGVAAAGVTVNFGPVQPK